MSTTPTKLPEMRWALVTPGDFCLAFLEWKRNMIFRMTLVCAKVETSGSDRFQAESSTAPIPAYFVRKLQQTTENPRMAQVQRLQHEAKRARTRL